MLYDPELFTREESMNIRETTPVEMFPNFLIPSFFQDVFHRHIYLCMYVFNIGWNGSNRCVDAAVKHLEPE